MQVPAPPTRGSLLDVLIFLMIVAVVGILLAPWLPSSIDVGLALAVVTTLVVTVSVLMIFLSKAE